MTSSKDTVLNDPLTGKSIEQLGLDLRKGSITCKELT